MKIISLVPSITETLFDFGLTSKEIIGRTKFCIHPKDKVSDIPKIGGTKNIQIDKINELQPDLIIANKEENTKEQVEELMKKNEVWLTDIGNFEDNIDFITALGKRLQQVQKAKQFNLKMTTILSQFQSEKSVRVAYLIWKNPYMSIGQDTYIHDILARLGFENIIKENRYPIVETTDFASADYIFLSSEPYPFNEKHIKEIQKNFSDKQVILVNGEAFSWYGTHLLKCEKYFAELTKKMLL